MSMTIALIRSHLQFTLRNVGSGQTSMTPSKILPAYKLYDFSKEARAICRSVRESVTQELALGDVPLFAALPLRLRSERTRRLGRRARLQLQPAASEGKVRSNIL